MHHFCCLAGYGAEAINPYLAFETLERCASQNGLPEEVDDYEVLQELHQGDRQGPAEGDVQDGHLDLPVLLRRADLRRRRPAVRASSRSTSPAPRPRSRASAWHEIAEETVRRHRDAFGDDPVYRTHARCRRRLRLPPARRGACLDAARPCRGCSTRCAATRRTSTRPSPSSINEQSERLLTIRGLFRIKRRRGGRPQPVPLDEVEPAAEIVKRFATGAMTLRLDLPRGAHHARHRHEPHRRQVEHRRGRRGGGSLQAAAQRRFHALGHQAGGVGPLRRHDRIPGQCRR